MDSPVTGEQTSEVTVKGWRNGLLLVLPLTAPWSNVIVQTGSKLDAANARSFWRGSQTTIDCGSRIVSQGELDTLLNTIKANYGLVPIAIVARDPGTREMGERLALVAYPELPMIRKQPAGGGPSQGYVESPTITTANTAMTATTATITTKEVVPETVAPVVAPWYPAGASPNALYIPGTIRSGQRIVHDGPIIVVGDVNPGAEVLSEGDIVVFGSLRGLAHAGCMGDEAARILAVNLRPPQLRIAGKIARSPEEDTGKNAPQRGAEVARIEKGEIQVFSVAPRL